MVLREARRFLQSSPILSLSAVAVLALGIGASALALALLLAFSSLTYPGMRALSYATIAEQTEGGGSMPISWQRFAELRASPEQNASLAAYSRQISTTLEIRGKGRPLKVAAVSRGFFSIFTPGLRVGRDFTRVEEGHAGTHVVILSLPFAVSLFKSPEAALNQFVEIHGLPFRVVGVAPRGFDGLFGVSVEAWVPANCVIPLAMDLPAWLAKAKPDAWQQPATFYGIAVSERVSSKELAAELSTSLPLRASTESALRVSQGLTTDPVRDAKLRKRLRFGLLLALVFTLVSALNYSLLLLARTPRYAEEVRLKKSLGAGSARLLAELMVGPAITVGAGLAAAALLWVGGLTLISRISPFYGQLVQGSWRAALLAFGVQVPFACALTLVIALVPTLGLLREDCTPRLGYGSTATRRAGALLQVVVTLQIAFCIGTWILAGMIVSSVALLMREPLGYDPTHLAAVYIGPGVAGVTFNITSRDRTFPRISVIKSLLDQVTALPGVRSAAFAGDAPLDSPMGTIELQRTGDSAPATPITVNDTPVSPGYFRTMGSTMIRGREFSWQDLAGSANEVVVNEALARELWPGANPVGRSVRLIYPRFSGIPSSSATALVIGVVENMRFSGITESPEPTVFESLKGRAFVTSDLIVDGSASIHSLEGVVSRQLTAQIPELRVLRTYSVADRARASLWPEKKRAGFALAGALVMALVAYIGLYGALAYYVNTRRRELAVRICLGALPGTIRRIVLARTARCALLATAVSAPLWPMLMQLSSSEYLGRVSWSTTRAVLLSLACVAVAIFISLVPAIAATNISPAVELKEQ